MNEASRLVDFSGQRSYMQSRDEGRSWEFLHGDSLMYFMFVVAEIGKSRSLLDTASLLVRMDAALLDGHVVVLTQLIWLQEYGAWHRDQGKRMVKS